MSGTSSRSSTSAPVIVGHVGRPHGVRGVVHARPTGPTLGALPIGEAIEVRPREDAPARSLRLLAREGSGERLRLTLEGVGDRDAAAALAGAVLEVAAERIVVPEDPDTWLVTDLVGCRVVEVDDAGGERDLGPVSEVHGLPANDVLEVAGSAGRLLIPFTADAVVEVAVPARTIRVRSGLVVDS
ncbi:MAG: ribosome maturation factor RimM [Miltoncostaeaceae bacterium]